MKQVSMAGQIYDFFFFQAEDGIRDYKVTGVQTCALPIYVHFVSIEHKMGIKASPTAVLQYGDNGGAIGYLRSGEGGVGEEGRFLGGGGQLKKKKKKNNLGQLDFT